ncbi:MAG: endo-1,4-beta-xylanase [Oscillospiraceae bacterium]|nr:endo-1,4-beta-xylanase [Oscillospiraceae bacterium]
MREREKCLEHLRDPETKKLLEKNIEKYRKGDGVLRILDAAGNPVTGVSVKLVHKKHECKFGANLFMLDEMESDLKNELYKKYFSEVFTMATLPFYWNATEPEKGHLRYKKGSSPMYRRPPIDRCMDFCRQYGIEPREHALAYDFQFPKWLKDLPVETVKQELERRYQEISERYGSEIRTIEVTNEMNWPEGMNVTSFYEDPEYLTWCYQMAEKYFSGNQIAINEAVNESWLQRGRVTDIYYAYVENLLLKGCRIDAIGMQFHALTSKDMISTEYKRMSPVMYNPKKILSRLDLYSRFGKPLQITEVTISAAGPEPENEQIQAELLEGLYTTWFAHPNVEQIIYWNLVDGYAYVPSNDPEVIGASQGNMKVGENRFYGGLLRFDMTPKPAYYTLKDLIQNKWHTEIEAVTDVNGQVRFNGFLGEYDIYLGETAQKYSGVLAKTTPEIIIVV